MAEKPRKYLSLLRVLLLTVLSLSFVGSAQIASMAGMLHLQSAYATFPGANDKIVFSSQKDGNQEIYSINPDGGVLTRLTNNPASDDLPRWSPDGSKIVFEHSSRGNYSNIYVMNADGSGVKALTNDTTDNMHFTRFDFAPSWSSDGTKIAFDFLSNGISGIDVINSDGTAANLGVPSGPDPGPRRHNPQWSPVGTKLLFDTLTGTYVWNIDENRIVKLPSTGESKDWSPDGTKIVFEEFNNTIFVTNDDGSGVPKAIPNTLNGTNPAWSPDGNKIAFSKNGTISVTNSDGSGNPTILPGSSGERGTIIWSPDSTKILFAKSDGLYVIDLTGGRSNLMQIYKESSSTLVGAPDWARSLEKPLKLTVKSLDSNGNQITGYWTVLYNGTSGSVLKTGFTPATFTLNPGQQYRIGMGNFGNYTFDFWPDINGSNHSQNPRDITIYQDAQLTAIYNTTTTTTTYPITHMSDSTANEGYGVHAPKPARAEYVTNTSQLVGDKIDSITMRLKRVGTINGTAEIGIMDNNDRIKKSFGTLDVATLTTKYSDYEFHLSNNELYTIQSGDRIGIKYTGGDANNWVSVKLDQNAADPFDGMHTYNQYYQAGKWLNHTEWDTYMILRQTHA